MATASKEIEDKAAETLSAFRAGMNGWKINDALKAVWTFVRALNKYVDVTMPWALAKDEAKAPLLDAVLYHLCEGMRFVSLMAEPVIPIASERSGTSWALPISRMQPTKTSSGAVLLTALISTKDRSSSRALRLKRTRKHPHRRK